MMDDETTDIDILEEEQALSGYFDALLGVNAVSEEDKSTLELEKKSVNTNARHIAPVFENEAVGVVVEPAIVTPLPDIQEIDDRIEEIEISEIEARIIAEPKPAILEEIETVIIDDPAEFIAPDDLLETEKIAEAECDSGVPAWARQEFQCVSFVVQGLQLIVPLEGLSQVYALQEQKIKTIFRSSRLAYWHYETG
ncbi:hypothetical protein [Piscirickettsia litoralis]|uniref:hypothetical protein n=1 Tax=Piscirickettsia litoralis TaxID=1891921 RepID=UPI001F29E1C6|nr:hypothetical protein [Piscirickettsia litoralis]